MSTEITAPVAAPATAEPTTPDPKVTAEAEETKKWADIKEEARKRRAERGHEAPAKEEPKAAAKTEPKEKPKAEAKPKTEPTTARDDKGRFAPTTAPEKTEPKPVEKVEAKPAPVKAEEPKPPEPPSDEAKRPKRTDAEINAAFARLKRDRREFESSRAAVESEKSELAAWKSEQAADKKLRETDPYGWLEKQGFDLVEVARRTKERSEMTAEQRELAAVKREIEELKKSPPRAEKEPELHETPGGAAVVDKAATAHAFLNEADFPLLRQEDPQEVGRAALAMDFEHYQRTKRHLDIPTIFRILEGNLKKDHQPASAVPQEEAGTSGAIRTESENGGPKDTGNRPPAVNNSLSARTTARQKPERGSREAAIARLDSILRS
jgi:hypothetical protein